MREEPRREETERSNSEKEGGEKKAANEKGQSKNRASVLFPSLGKSCEHVHSLFLAFASVVQYAGFRRLSFPQLLPLSLLKRGSFELSTSRRLLL